MLKESIVYQKRQTCHLLIVHEENTEEEITNSAWWGWGRIYKELLLELRFGGLVTVPGQNRGTA